MTHQTSDLEAQLEVLRQEAQQAIATAETLDQLDQLRVKYLGKKGQLSQALGGMGKLPPEERPRIGALTMKSKKLCKTI
jgi:phenylalanyl-tRNA synthetase alpha chain